MAEASKGATRLSPIAALPQLRPTPIYATFFADALRLPSVYVVDQYTHRRLLSGQIGYIEEVFYLPDLIRILAVSLLIFVLVWWGACIAAKFAYEARSARITPPQEIVTTPLLKE